MSSTDATLASAPARPAGAGITTFGFELIRIAAVSLALFGLAWFYSGTPFILNILAYTFLFARDLSYFA